MEMEEMMEEKTYKRLASAGGGNIALGILTITFGLACGILMIVNGAKVLKAKSEILI